MMANVKNMIMIGYKVVVYERSIVVVLSKTINYFSRTLQFGVFFSGRKTSEFHHTEPAPRPLLFHVKRSTRRL